MFTFDKNFNIMKKLFTVIAVTMMIVGLAACSKKDSKPQINKSLKNTGWTAMASSNMQMNIYFYDEPNGSINAQFIDFTNPVTVSTVWHQQGDYFSITYTLPGNPTRSTSGSFDGTTFILEGTRYDKK